MTRQLPTVQPQTFELPSEAVMQELDLDHIDYGDFAACLKLLSYQTDGLTFKAAAAAAGIPIRTLYEKRWVELLAKARRVATGYLMHGVANASAQVYQEWPAIVNSIIDVAKNGKRDHEKVAAAELLHHIFIEPIQQAPSDDTAEREYLKKPKNFNPSAPIQVNEGGTVIINNVAPPKAPNDFIDVQAS